MSPKSSRNTAPTELVQDLVSKVTGATRTVADKTVGRDNVVSKTVDITNKAITDSVSSATNALSNSVEYGGNTATDFVDALQDVVSGLIDGASSVVETTGDVTERMLNDVFDVRATHVFNGAGNLVRSVANSIGGVVRENPTVGNATAYVDESLGGGAYHVLLSVGKLVGSASRRLGSVAKRTSDLVVFTLNVGDEQLRDTTNVVDDLVHRLTHTLTGQGEETLQKAGRESRRRRGVQKRRGGVRRSVRRRQRGGC